MRTSIRVILVFLLFVPPLASQEKTPVPVAIFFDGKTGTGKQKVPHTFAKYREFRVESIGVQDIQAGKLKNYQVLIVPGGSASKKAKILEAEGRAAIRQFVEQGGSYLGICAGSYLATNDYDWSLGLLNARVVDRKHWARGHGPVQITFTDEGKKILAAKDNQAKIIYWQGPLLVPGDKKDPPAFATLARFETEIAHNGAPEGVMKGTVAIAAGTFGKGRVVCFSPHPEKLETTHELLKMALLWLNVGSQ